MTKCLFMRDGANAGCAKLLSRSWVLRVAVTCTVTTNQTALFMSELSQALSGLANGTGG